MIWHTKRKRGMGRKEEEKEDEEEEKGLKRRHSIIPDRLL